MNTLDKFLTEHPPKNGKYHKIAIDGRGGSGKSTLSKRIHETFREFILLPGDDYFEPVNDGVVWGYFNDERFIKDVVNPLKTGDSFIYRPFDWHTEPHITDIPITINKGLILERCYSFSFDLDWDVKIWVETPKEICMARGLKRENMEQQKSLRAWQVWQAAEDVYTNQRRPQAEANFVIDGTAPFSEQFSLSK